MKAKEVIEEAIERLNYLISGDCTDNQMGFVEEITMAIDALEKQMPKKPDYEGDGYDDSGNLIYDTWICPNCGDRYEVDYEIHSHCPMCGQAIDWSDYPTENGGVQE